MRSDLKSSKNDRWLGNANKNVFPIATEALFYFFTNQFDNITKNHIDGLRQLFESSQQNVADFIAPAQVVQPVAALTCEQLSVNKENLKSLLGECRKEQFAIHLLEAAVNNDLRLVSPFSDNMAYCQESYAISPLMTWLRFKDGGHCFFLIQLFSSAAGLYFPEANVLIAFGHVKADDCTRMYAKLVAEFPRIVDYAKSKNQFFGAIVSYDRPAHFYYDIWPVLFETYEKGGLYQKTPHIVMRTGQDYFDLDLLFKHDNYRVYDSQEIDQLSLNTNQWFLNLGTDHHFRKNTSCFDKADPFLVGAALQHPSKIAVDKAKVIKDCGPVVWLGVEGQKRCWLEQVEGYAFILNKLASRFPRLGVVIDGWTAPLSPSAQALKESQKDRDIADAIISGLTQPLPNVYLMGETSHTKLYVGNKVDFFITNFATGSMHISRLLGKPGFCHLSNALTKASLQNSTQIHPNRQVYLLPQQYVQDKPSVQGSSVAKLISVFTKRPSYTQQANDAYAPGRTSYSIDKREFYRFIEGRLDKVLDKKGSTSPCYFLEPLHSIDPVIKKYLKMASYNKIITVHAPHIAQISITNLTRLSENYLNNHVIYGLFFFGVHDRLGLRGSYLVWLKDPWQRVLDHARHIAQEARNKNQPSDLKIILKSIHCGLDNHYTRLISGMDAAYGECSEAMFNMAIDNLGRHFKFIGIVSQLSRSLDRLCVLMDWDRSLFPDEIPMTISQADCGISEADDVLAQKLIKYDKRLYSAALAMVDEYNANTAASR